MVCLVGWCVVVWYGVVVCGVVWLGDVWYGVVVCGMVWLGGVSVCLQLYLYTHR